jgi:hypothetical protein
MDDQMTVEQWLAARKEAGREIDIETCELGCWHTRDFDPYLADPDLPEEWNQISRNWFVRSPSSRGWVHYGDLPEAALRAMWDRIERERARRAALNAKILFGAIVSRLLVLNADMNEARARESATGLINNCPSTFRNSVDPELARLLVEHNLAQQGSKPVDRNDLGGDWEPPF